jgi:proteasome assembly chaperone (PAC2) family protein
VTDGAQSAGHEHRDLAITGGARDAAGPVMVLAFEGWNDAGDAASAAIEHLELLWDAEPYGELDPEEYYDFQVIRPTIHMVGGVTRRVELPTTRLSRCRPAGAGRDVTLVSGIEPNMRWRRFCRELIARMREAGTVLVVTLGALLAETPHTRPVPIIGAGYDAESAARYGLQSCDYEGPTGIVGLLQDACVREGIPAVSFWAQVPHYVSQAPDPKATIALLRRLEDVLDTEVPLGNLPDAAEEWEQTVTEMAGEDEEVAEYVRSLEERGDTAAGLAETSGDAIAAEFERYLRRRRGGPGGQAGLGGPAGR